MCDNVPETLPAEQGSNSEQSDSAARAGSGSAPPDLALLAQFFRHLPASKIHLLTEPFLQWIRPRARYVQGTGLWIIWNADEGRWAFDDNEYTKTNPIIWSFVRPFSLSDAAWDKFYHIVMPRRSCTGKLMREPRWVLDALAGIGTEQERLAAIGAMVVNSGVVAVNEVPVSDVLRRFVQVP